MWHFRIAAAAALASLAACSSVAPQRMNATAPPPNGGARCESAAATATMFSKASAIHYAKVRLGDEIGEAKSELNTVPGAVARAGDTSVQCEPYYIFGQRTSLHTCVATARVCQH